MKDSAKLAVKQNEGNNSENGKIMIDIKLLGEDESDNKLDPQQRIKKNKENVDWVIKDFFLDMIEKTVTKQYGYTKVKSCILIIFTEFAVNEKDCVKEIKIVNEYSTTSFEDKVYIIDLTKASKCDNPDLKNWLMMLTSNNPSEYYGKSKTMDRAIDMIYEMNREMEKNKK